MRRPRRRGAHASPDAPTPGRTIDALAGVSLRLTPATFTALLGPNGSGKTTLLRLIATLDEPDAGELAVLGFSGAHRQRARAGLGVVFQSPALDRTLTGMENLRTHAALFGIDRREADRRTRDLAERFGVADRLHDRVRTLSGGLARRVELVRALLTRPKLLLLDEPTTALDPPSRDEFLRTLAAARTIEGDAVTIVMTTHDLDAAERAGRVVLLHEGRVVGDDAPDALRRELGDTLLETPPGDASAHEHLAQLTPANLTIAPPDALGRLRVTGPADAVAAAASALAAAGLAFRVGPPTLGDVFAARTGAALNPAPRDGAGS